ncbi:MAG: 2-succinyl-5-enolpyruvyl-6-hydroxy-3-cyclohexene-1-carboxylic-acid synthase [Bacteroidetes bacterium]|nr:MAG: 2-succinyl-5-enolpyruvyl-6-hydroxy-3-cyclohexene-1-carboxylic-acid synthase [Bacteroidota bacterium]
MKFSKKILSQSVTQLCIAKEISHVVISPGSRNAPLIIGFTEHSYFKDFSIVHERSAAFFAVGMAQQLKRPVILVCTSGSALLNYYPAIAEAFYSDIPLVIISADRPTHLIDIGDGQTIRQENVFARHILYSANCKEGEEHQDFNETEINTALNTAIEHNGPVHINIPFSEPLYELTDVSITPRNVAAAVAYDPVNSSNDTMAELITSEIDNEVLRSFKDHWDTAERKMILVGTLSPNSIEQKYLDTLAEDESVIVLTETTSNLHHEHFFPAIDQLIAPLDENGFKALQPELLLTFGGMIVSKKIKAFLRDHPPKYHYHIDPKKALDTFFVLTSHLPTDVNVFLNWLTLDNKQVKGNYRKYWLTIKEHRVKRHSSYEIQIPFSDFMVYSRVFENLPKNIQLQLANSTTIRYAQLFDLHPSFEVFCNRGTSGIDGTTSTAIGAAKVSKLPTILITGDLSFLYDSNALWNDHIPKHFKIIIVNNSGGGIFRILPGAKELSHFKRFFETRHGLTAEYLCKMHDLDYASVNEAGSLESALTEFFKNSEKPKLLEIFTPAEVNDIVLLEYFDFIK